MTNTAPTNEPIVINDREFVDTFKPVQNHIDSSASYEGCLFKYSGSELEHVKAVFKATPNHVWTVSDDWSVVEGMQHVNRLGYLITEMPAADNATYYVYDEDAAFEEDGIIEGEECGATSW